MAQDNTDAQRQRFCKILRDTARENIDYVIEDLEDLGFFDAPASSQGHYSYPGGLVEHSLNVYDAAIAIRDLTIRLRPDITNELSDESIAIAALLHDVCKADLYVAAKRKKRNEIGIYESQDIYEIHDEHFPIGHGEKSAMILLRSGLDISEDELCAIRWHMGPWNLSRDDEKFYRQAGRNSPLPPLIHAADTVASSLLERQAKKL